MEVRNNPLETMLCGVRLANPVILGSGPVGDSTVRLLECLQHGAGAVINKTLHWEQNLTKIMVRPRYFYGDGYMLNCERGNELPWQAWKDYGIAEVKRGGPLLVSLGGTNIKDAARLAAELVGCQPSLYEANVSCPHSERKKLIRRDYVTELVQALKAVIGTTPLMMKLGYAPDLVELAQTAQAAGADAICTTNSIGPGLAIDVRSGKPRLGILGGSGGVSGAAIKPIALHCVAAVSRAVHIPVVGCGGVRNANDVIELMMAGATAVEVYTEIHLQGPQVFRQIVHGLHSYVREMGLHSLNEIVGATHIHLNEEHSSPRPLLAKRWKGFRQIETGLSPGERGNVNSEAGRPRLVVIGDANLDTVVDLRQADLREFGQSDINLINGAGSVQTPMRMVAGGSGVLFANAAQSAGFHTSLICKLGCSSNGQLDLSGQVILKSLAQAGVQSLYTTQGSGQSGKILILNLPSDRRLMVSDRGVNSQFGVDDITHEMRAAIGEANVLHISGYSFLVPEQRIAVQMLAWHAKEHGALVSLDVVPHHLYQFFSFQEFVEATRAVDILTIELATALRFIGGHINTSPKWEINAEHPVIVEFLRHYPCLVLRPDNQTQVVVTAKSLSIEATGYTESTNKTGYLDKLLAKTLFTILIRRQEKTG